MDLDLSNADSTNLKKQKLCKPNHKIEKQKSESDRQKYILLTNKTLDDSVSHPIYHEDTFNTDLKWLRLPANTLAVKDCPSDEDLVKHWRHKTGMKALNGIKR